MSKPAFLFDHIHIISQEPKVAAQWYEDVLGAIIEGEYDLRNAPSINVQLGGITIIIRGKRPGEKPNSTSPIQHYKHYSSHNEWGTDHFGFTYDGDLKAFCEEIRAKGAIIAVEPWEFLPGSLICYVSAPDGVSIELTQAKPEVEYA